jgi:hypothetical protein
MLMTLVVVSAGAVALPVVVSQVTSTRITVRSGSALQAAEDGLEAAVAAVRVAVGDDAAAELPCGPIVESAPSAGNARVGAAYSVSLDYYTADPADSPTSLVSTCADVQSGSIKPQYLRLTSTGTPRTSAQGEGRRTLRGDLPIRFPLPTPTAPTATGTVAPTPSAAWGPQYDDLVNPRPLMAYSTTLNDKKCFDPGSQSPSAGAGITLQTCNVDNVQDNSYQQNWYYQDNLTLAAVSGILSGRPMCLDGGLVPAAGLKVTMQACASPVPPSQRWYYNTYGNYELAGLTGGLSGFCLNAQTPGQIGSAIVLGTGADCHSATWNNRQTFSTYTKIGPGEAGSRSIDCTSWAGYPCLETQLVNNGMPSRCIDHYTTFMANLECVQDPNLANVRWSQLWRLPEWQDGPAGVIGPMVVVNPSNNTSYCLTTAATWPTLVSCNPTSPTAAQKWHFYRRTGDDFTQFRIVDANGKCLTHPNGTSSMASSAKFYWNQASYHWKLVVDTCVNSANAANTADIFNQASVLRRQKWNAPMLLSDKSPTATSSPATTAPTATVNPSVTPAPGPPVDATPMDGTTLPLQNIVELTPPQWTGP